ncbi:MAG: glycosyltransferase, partial [Janthinobacterium lividum]
MTQTVTQTETPGNGTSTVPRVLFVADALSNNGAISITVDLTRRWGPAGARLVVLSGSGEGRRPPAGTRVEYLAGRSGRIREGMVRGLPRLLRRAREADVVVTASEIGPGMLAAYLAARLTRRPFVVAVHADLDEALQEWISPRLHAVSRWAHRHADGALCVAEALVAPLVRNGLPVERTRVVRNGIDLAAIRTAARQPGSLITAACPGLPVVVATGRLAPQKGYDLLLRAHARLVTELPHRVLIMNDGPEEPALKQLAEDLGIRASVDFVGVGTAEALLPTVAAADLFCLPSRHEGLPLALLEAVALGVPIIATDCAEGVRVAVDGGRVADLVTVEDVDALAACIGNHLRDPAPLRRKAALAQEHAEKFDRAIMAAEWVEALRGFIAGSARRGARPV